MKKLTKLHMVLIIVLIIVLAGSVQFSFSYRRAEAKQPDIKDEIKLAQMRLGAAKEDMNPEPLKKQLEEKQSTIKMLSGDEPLFPERPPTVEIGDLIVDSVEKINLVLLKLKPNDEAGTVTIYSDEDSTGNKYNKAEYEVTVKGDLGRINSLIGAIEAADFATLTIEDLQIEYKESEEEEHITKWWEGTFTVVTLYQYKEEE
jgi:hypothetical protein